MSGLGVFGPDGLELCTQYLNGAIESWNYRSLIRFRGLDLYYWWIRPRGPLFPWEFGQIPRIEGGRIHVHREGPPESPHYASVNV